MNNLVRNDLGRHTTPANGYQRRTPPSNNRRFVGIGSTVQTPQYGYKPFVPVIEPTINEGKAGDVMMRIDNASFAGHRRWIDSSVLTNVVHDNTLTGAGQILDPLGVILVDGGVF